MKAQMISENPCAGEPEAGQIQINTRPLLARLRNRHFFIMDLVLLSFTPALALALRISLPWDPIYNSPLLIFTGLALLIKLPILFKFQLYNCYWRYASIDEMVSIILGALTALAATTILFFGLHAFPLAGFEHLPRSLPLIDALLTLIFIGGTRFGTRIAEHRSSKHRLHPAGQRRVLVAGAGDAGEMIVREMRTSAHLDLLPVGFVDDDRSKHGATIHGIRVLGGLKDIPVLVSALEVQEVIIAMPTAPGKTIREVVKFCDLVGVPSRALPGIYELLNGRASISRIRKVEIGDLLRRDTVKVDLTSVHSMLAGKRVLVTGGGGSIGSELCVQILMAHPAEVIALGHGEYSLFNLVNHINQLRPSMNGARDLPLITVLADIRDHCRLKTVFREFRPEIVFHAAAHKHIPFTEDNVDDAITTNVIGTRNLIDLSEAYGIERFVLISTDKAVNPVNILGRTKRIAELLVQEAHQTTGRPFVAVRFGNVLGSRGSVVPYFQHQIASGGPLTVTHPDVSRFFMTIPEAVQLVLQAATLGSSREVFVLDMGNPVRIADLARDMVELSGYQLGRDMDIVYTGLRPGEKLAEELFTIDERPVPTRYEKILMARSEKPLQIGFIQREVDRLETLAKAGRIDDARILLERLTATSASLSRTKPVRSSSPREETIPLSPRRAW